MGHHVHLAFTWGSVDLTSGPHAWTTSILSSGPSPEAWSSVFIAIHTHCPRHSLYKQFSPHAPLPVSSHPSPSRVVPSLHFTAQLPFNSSKLESRLPFSKTYRHPCFAHVWRVIFFLLLSSCGIYRVNKGGGGRWAGWVERSKV